MTAIRPRHWPRWTLARRLCALAFLGLLLLGHLAWFPYFAGSTTATRIANRVPLADPLAALEVTLAARQATWDTVVGAGLLVLVAAVLGPVFCGWVCPLGLLLDLNDWLGRRIRRRRKSPAGVATDHGQTARLTVLGLCLGFSLTASIPLFQVLSPINMVGWPVAITWTVDASLVVVAVILVVEHFRPRIWCRALCPLGALYSLLGRFAPWRVRVGPEQQSRLQCRQCTLHCPMGIHVMEDYVLKERTSIDHPACTRCGACLDACPGSVLKLGIR